MTINPTENFAIVELERVKWFLGHLDLTIDDRASDHIQQAYSSVNSCLKRLRTVKGSST